MRAFYAKPGSRLGDALTLLHPPYTAWHLGYVALGAGLAPRVDVLLLLCTLLAFFLGLGVGAHALDELKDRPLRTRFSDRALWWTAGLSLGGAVALAVTCTALVSPWLVAWAGLGVFLACAYNLEWFGGRLHGPLGFGLAWGAFPVLAGYYAQTASVSGAALLAAAAAFLFSLAQRRLSVAARFARRKAQSAETRFVTEGGPASWPREELLATWEEPLRLLSWGMALLGAGLAWSGLG